MESFSFRIGTWQADALLEQIDPGKLMAVISVKNGKGSQGGSRHTVVFEHESGADTGVETEALVRHLLHERYGI